jgi:hypothetical protein
MTAQDALTRSVGGNHTKSKKNIHASHAQDTRNGPFRPAVHIQFSDQEYRQDAHGEIAKRRESAVDIGHVDDSLHRNAGALDAWVECDLGPKILKRVALQQHQEHKCQAAGDGEEHDGVQNPVVYAFHRDPHQEDAD